MIASVSVYESYNKFEQNDFYFWRRMGQILFASGGFFLTLFTPYKLWEKLSLPIMMGTIFLLFLVFTALGGDF